MENDFIMVRGVKVDVDKSSVNKDFHLKKFLFCIEKLKIFDSKLLHKIVWHKYTPTINGNLLGKIECVFDIFAQYYGNFRFCIMGALNEQSKVKETLQKLDCSVEYITNIDDIDGKLRKNQFSSIAYFPHDGMMFEGELSEYENEILKRLDFQIIQAKEATDEFFKELFKKQYIEMKKKLEIKAQQEKQSKENNVCV